MKTRIPSVVALIGIFGLGLALPRAAQGYDAPNFDKRPFSADGIFLPASEKQSLLEALTSLAVNFPSSRQVDNDMKEKALGLALQIDPLHHSSRKAHEALINGDTPATTNYFDSLSGISEALWRTAATLLRPPAEPEEVRLAPFLMELSLLVHPDPPTDRLESFALHSRGGSPGWAEFLELQPDTERSSREAELLFQEANELLRATLRERNRPAPGEGPVGTSPRPMVTSVPPGGTSEPNPTTPPKPTSGEVEPRSSSLPGIHTVAAVSAKPIFGETRLVLREPLFALGSAPGSSASSELGESFLPLRDPDRGIPLSGLEIPRALLAERGWKWPAGIVGAVTFETDQVLPGPRRVSRVSARLPILALLEMTLGGKERNDSFLLIGDSAEDGAAPSIGGEFADLVEALPDEAPTYLLVPASVLDDLVYQLQVTDDLSLLFAHEWVGYAEAEEAIGLVTGETPAGLSEATVAFREIEAVSERMSLVDLARNAKVQERLQGILDGYPQHLSAQAMLEYGTRPRSPEVEKLSFANQIRSLIVPFLVLDEDQIEIPDLQELRDLVKDTDTALFRIRSELPSDLLDFHSGAVEIFEAAEAYLTLSNPTTSMGQQRLRELAEALEKWEAAGTDIFGEDWVDEITDSRDGFRKGKGKGPRPPRPILD